MRRIDFSLDPVTGRWRQNPMDQVAGLLVEAAQQEAIDLVATMTLAETVTGGVGHNLPQEAPQAFAEAIIEVDGW